MTHQKDDGPLRDARELPLAEIGINPRGRPVEPRKVKALADSMAEIGLRTPITVRWGTQIRDGREVDGWVVLVGSHRCEAARRLKWDTISCIVSEDDDLTAELWEIDENLCRAELSPAQVAEHTARRKALYERLHPETRQGAAPAAGRGRGKRPIEGGQVGHLPTERFSAETAKRTGRSERVVRRAAERGTKVVPEALAKVQGTRLDTGAYLDDLKKLPREEQLERVEADLKAPAPAKAASPEGAAVAAARPCSQRRSRKRVAKYRLERFDRVFGALDVYADNVLDMDLPPVEEERAAHAIEVAVKASERLRQFVHRLQRTYEKTELPEEPSSAQPDTETVERQRWRREVRELFTRAPDPALVDDLVVWLRSQGYGTSSQAGADADVQALKREFAAERRKLKDKFAAERRKLKDKFETADARRQDAERHETRLKEERAELRRRYDALEMRLDRARGRMEADAEEPALEHLDHSNQSPRAAGHDRKVDDTDMPDIPAFLRRSKAPAERA